MENRIAFKFLDAVFKECDKFVTLHSGGLMEKNSEEGFDRTTLYSKVKETLQQIDAKIEAWKED